MSRIEFFRIISTNTQKLDYRVFMRKMIDLGHFWTKNIDVGYLFLRAGATPSTPGTTEHFLFFFGHSRAIFFEKKNEKNENRENAKNGVFRKKNTKIAPGTRHSKKFLKKKYDQEKMQTFS